MVCQVYTGFLADNMFGMYNSLSNAPKKRLKGELGWRKKAAEMAGAHIPILPPKKYSALEVDDDFRMLMESDVVNYTSDINDLEIVNVEQLYDDDFNPIVEFSYTDVELGEIWGDLGCSTDVADTVYSPNELDEIWDDLIGFSDLKDTLKEDLYPQNVTLYEPTLVDSTFTGIFTTVEDLIPTEVVDMVYDVERLNKKDINVDYYRALNEYEFEELTPAKKGVITKYKTGVYSGWESDEVVAPLDVPLYQPRIRGFAELEDAVYTSVCSSGDYLRDSKFYVEDSGLAQFVTNYTAVC